MLRTTAGRQAPAGRPLRSDAERNRQRIITAAREVFAERGLDATLDDIADHAGVGVATVYRRFSDKEALVEVLFEQGLDDLVAVAEAALKQPDSWAGVVYLLSESLELLAADRGLREVVRTTRYGRGRVARARQRVLPAATKVFDRAQADGVLRADLARADVPLLFVMVGAVVDYTIAVDPALWRRYLTLLLDGLRVRRGKTSPLPSPALGNRALERAMRGPRAHRR